jgi:hypothetical protein
MDTSLDMFNSNQSVSSHIHLTASSSLLKINSTYDKLKLSNLYLSDYANNLNSSRRNFQNINPSTPGSININNNNSLNSQQRYYTSQFIENIEKELKNLDLNKKYDKDSFLLDSFPTVQLKHPEQNFSQTSLPKLELNRLKNANQNQSEKNAKTAAYIVDLNRNRNLIKSQNGESGRPISGIKIVATNILNKGGKKNKKSKVEEETETPLKIQNGPEDINAVFKLKKTKSIDQYDCLQKEKQLDLWNMNNSNAQGEKPNILMVLGNQENLSVISGSFTNIEKLKQNVGNENVPPVVGRPGRLKPLKITKKNKKIYQETNPENIYASIAQTVLIEKIDRPFKGLKPLKKNLKSPINEIPASSASYKIEDLSPNEDYANTNTLTNQNTQEKKVVQNNRRLSRIDLVSLKNKSNQFTDFKKTRNGSISMNKNEINNSKNEESLIDSFDIDSNLYVRVESPHVLGKSVADYEHYTHSSFNQKLNPFFEIFQSKVYNVQSEANSN